MNTDHQKFYDAMLARDYRFDGKFFVGVKTTGIYCRPICPARPKIENVEFFSSSPAAEKAGYRPCLRCRPESAPLSPVWYGKSAIVARALRAIIDLGMNGVSEEAFAAKYGVTARHLRRLFVGEIGKTPRQFYEEQKLNLARKMLAETRLPVTEICYASGFQSLRRFNAAFKARFSRAPGVLRKAKPAGSDAQVLTSVSLSYRPPYNWDALIRYLMRHQTDDIEEISTDAYIRYFPTRNGMGRVIVKNDPAKSRLAVYFDHFDREQLYGLIQNIRRLFDLDADPLLISTQLEKVKILKKLDDRSPGVRAPGSWNALETAVGIILGQVVSMAQARRNMRELLIHCGEERLWHDKKVFVFPDAAKLADADLDGVPVAKQRKETIRLLCRKIVAGDIELNAHQDPSELKKQLRAIPGIGDWSAEYIGMRCLGDPDSCPRTDLILKRIADLEPDLDFEKARPWRAYVAFLLWNAYAGKLAKKRGKENGPVR
jgi:AraC family transcriptional regulator of adaptative response / DNA-3-methyladenine glycosylase II